MLKTKEELINDIQKYFDKIVFNIKKQNSIIKFCADTYDCPEILISDYLRGQKVLTATETDLLYYFSKAIDNQSKSQLIRMYFTEAEQKVFNELKYQKEEIKFPLRFKMLPVEVDSWIGPVTAKELVRLYQKQLINYNANTQRALQYVFREGKSTYRIAVNRQAIKAISDSLKLGRYISNTLTLNIPMDSGSSFYYNAAQCELVIDELKSFDILDGYHRLLAIFQVMNENNDFDYKMELRITNYDDAKAKQFIFQEDQKTKMKKVDSDAYNVYSFANRVINKINTDPLCDIQGMITMSGENISQAWLNSIIHCIWFKKISQNDGRQIVNEVTDALITAFNALVNYNPEYLNKRYSYKELLSVCYYGYKIYNKNSYNNLGENISSLISELEKDDDIRLVPSKSVTVSLISHIEKLAGEK